MRARGGVPSSSLDKETPHPVSRFARNHPLPQGRGLQCAVGRHHNLAIPRGKRLAMAMTVELPLEQTGAGLPQAGHPLPANDAPRARSRWSSLTRPALGLMLPVTFALVWEFI